MIFYTYVLFSPKRFQYVVGQCNESLERVLLRHNSGMKAFTKTGSPWQLVYSKGFDNSCDSYLLFKKLQNTKSRQFMRYHIDNLRQTDNY